MENIIDLLKRYDALQNRALAQELASNFQPAPDLQEEQKLSVINNITQGNAGIGSFSMPRVSTTYPVSAASAPAKREETYTWTGAGPVWGAGGWSSPGAITAGGRATSSGVPIRWTGNMENVGVASGPMPGTPGGVRGGGGGVQLSNGAMLNTAATAAAVRAGGSSGGSFPGRIGAPSGYVDPSQIYGSPQSKMTDDEYTQWLLSQREGGGWMRQY